MVERGWGVGRAPYPIPHKRKPGKPVTGTAAVDSGGVFSPFRAFEAARTFAAPIRIGAPRKTGTRRRVPSDIATGFFPQSLPRIPGTSGLIGR